MKKDFKFIDKSFALEMDGSAETEGDFQKCRSVVLGGGVQHKGIFKLTKFAWEAANKKAQEKKKPLVEILIDGCIDALKAELYIRPIPEGFSYIVDHRFFESL
ncbi:MAG TPA: hypothetical protein VFQ43_00595 [Nitrososphaera sp.]|nr:hypothetical protein [Nitrososphaera sp.]